MDFNFCINEDGQLVSKIIFDAWKGFHSEDLINDDEEIAPGEIEIVAAEAGFVGEMSEFSPEKKTAMDYLFENQEEVKDSILNALLPFYQEWRSEFEEDMDDDEITEDMEMPKITSIDQFADVLLPDAVYLFDSAKDGVSYCGFCFHATWEVEHGLGIVVHKNRVVKIGPMNIAMHGDIDE